MNWIVPLKKPLSRVHELLILDSSFNPPTIAHFAMLSRAKRLYPNADEVLLISSRNADKGANDIQARIQVLEKFNLPLASCSTPLFYQKASLFPEGVKCIFLLGYDTVVRFFDSKYYNDVNVVMQNFFKNAKIVCFERHLNKEVGEIWNRPEMKSALDWKSHIDVFDDFDMNISSTMARSMLKEYYSSQNDQEKLNDLEKIIPQPALQTILESRLYS